MRTCCFSFLLEVFVCAPPPLGATFSLLLMGVCVPWTCPFLTLGLFAFFKVIFFDSYKMQKEKRGG